MIAIMIDRKLERMTDVIEYTFSFIFDTLGYPYRFIDKINELREGEIIFFYGLLEPSNEEKQLFTKNPVVFFTKAETDLLNTGKINREDLLAHLHEIRLHTVIPVWASKEFQHPLITYKVGEIFWGQFNFDIVGNIFFHLSGYENIYSTTQDSQRILTDENLPFIAYKAVPYVNALLWMIESFLQEAISTRPVTFLIKKEYWPNSEEFAYVLSHNIDTLRKWSLSNLFGSILTDLKLFVLFKWNSLFRNLKEKINFLITNYEVYWNFDEIREILKEHGVKATFFVGASDKKQQSSNIDYSLKDPELQTELSQILEENNEISLLAYCSSNKDKHLENQLNQLANIAGQRVKGIRYLWGEYDIQQVTAIHNELDILYDSSQTLRVHCGFRNGIAFPYKPYHSDKRLKYWEIPLAFSDSILELSKYSVLSKEKAQSLIKKLVTTVKKTNGVMIFNFSISKFNDIRYNDQLMDFTLRYMAQNNAYSGTLREIADWWNARTKVEITVEGDDIVLYCPESIQKITLSVIGNRTVKKITGAKGTITAKTVSLSNIKKGDKIVLATQQDDQLYLQIEDEDNNPL